jgi:RNA polymerase sigma factor (sigma-70 family)
MTGGIEKMCASQFKSENYNEYKTYLSMLGENNSATQSLLIKNLGRAIREELTEKQWQSIRMYYIEGIKMQDIAQILGVNISTVSRSIKRGKLRLKRCLRYGARELINDNVDIF